jgi:hypothetical protein
VDLPDAGAEVKSFLRVRLDARLGEEGGARQAAGGASREVERPVVEVGGHAGAVRVGQGAEHRDAQVAQRVEAFLLGAAVGDRPRPADQRAGLVEVGPDAALHARGQEVGVDVGEAGEAVTVDHVTILRLDSH